MTNNIGATILGILAPILLAGWCLIAYGIGRLLYRPARRIFHARRENLAMLR